MSAVRLVAALGLTATLSGCAADVDLNCIGGAALCDIAQVVGDDRAAAAGIAVTRVAWTQGVQTDLMADGLAMEPELSVVAGRPAMVRVFVEPEAGFEVRDLSARFYLFQDGEVVGAGQGDGRPVGVSDIQSLGSTLNIELPGHMLQPGSYTWKVEVVEATPGVRYSGSSRDAVFESSATMTVQDAGDGLRIYLVPVVWNGDGSGRVPSTGPDALEVFRREMMAIYPVANVEIELGEPMEYSGTVDAGGGGWSQLLQTVGELRDERGVDSDQYIYGLFTPFPSPHAGVYGLSNLAGSPMDAGSRASIGVSFSAGDGYGTMAHEVGHAHGRPHSPCGGAAGPDPDYPHEGASIGSWGYHLFSRELRDPAEYVDYMSYCSPEWMSDYNWEITFQRNQDIFEMIGGGGPDLRTVKQPWRPVWLHSDGQVTEGEVRWLNHAPKGQARSVSLLDEHGVVMDEVQGVFTPFDHVEGGVLLVPGQDLAPSLRIDDRLVHPVPLQGR